MTLSACIGLSLAMLILAASPGPGVMATTGRALASGFRPALMVICGIVLGDILFLLLATFGMSIVAGMLGELFFLIKIVGSCYLLYLGIRMWRTAAPSAPASPTTQPSGALGNFISGLVITLSNPKVILFYCGFLPTFLDLSNLTPTDLLLVVTLLSTILGGVLSCYGYLASRARHLFVRPRAVNRLNKTAGGVMIAAGASLALR